MNRTLVLIALASLTGAAFAVQKSGREPREMVSRGQIVAVSTEERTVTLEETVDPGAKPSPGAMQSGVRREFIITEATRLTADGEPIELDEIRMGALATIHFVMDEGKNVALAIEVRSPATE